MANTTGNKYGGRVKGTPNRLTKELRTVLKDIFYLFLFRKTNFMRNLLLILALTITSGVLYSQSKKNQIEQLQYTADSLNRVLNAEKNTSLEKSNKISDLERTISSLNTNVSKLTTELQKSKA